MALFPLFEITLSSNLLLKAVIYPTEPGEFLCKIFLVPGTQNSVTSAEKFVAAHTLEYVGPAVISTACPPAHTRHLGVSHNA